MDEGMSAVEKRRWFVDGWTQRGQVQASRRRRAEKEVGVLSRGREIVVGVGVDAVGAAAAGAAAVTAWWLHFEVCMWCFEGVVGW